MPRCGFSIPDGFLDYRGSLRSSNKLQPLVQLFDTSQSTVRTDDDVEAGADASVLYVVRRCCQRAALQGAFRPGRQSWRSGPGGVSASHAAGDVGGLCFAPSL